MDVMKHTDKLSPEFIRMYFPKYKPNENYETEPEPELEVKGKILDNPLKINFFQPNFGLPPNGIVSLFFMEQPVYNGPVGNLPVITFIPPSPPPMGQFGVTYMLNGVPHTAPSFGPFDVGGVDFTDLKITGFSVNEVDGAPEFISNAVAGADSVNVDSLSDNFMRYFMEALILKPENLFVSLDVINNEGSARLNPVMEQTHIARIMLDHDILMKSDFLATALTGLGNPAPVDAGYTADWIDLFEASPFFSQYVQMGFGVSPYVQARGVIVGDTVTVYTDSNRVFLQEAPLTLDYAIEDVGLDKSGFNFNQAQLDDLDSMLAQFRAGLQYRLDTAAVRFIDFINTSGRYAELRSAFRAIAMAKIYKDIDFAQNPYAHLIDTDAFPPGFGHSEPFPKEYYDSQAYQVLNQELFTDLSGQVQQIDVWGGVTMEEYNSRDSFGLTVLQREIFNQADTSFLQDGDNYYLPGGSIGFRTPELYPGLFGIAPADTNDLETTLNEPLSISATIFNMGNQLATGIKVSIFDEFYDADSIRQVYKVGDVLIDTIHSLDHASIAVNWQSFSIGPHEFRIVVDAEDKYAEVDEENNTRVMNKLIYPQEIVCFIEEPAPNAIVPNSNIDFNYYALSSITGIPYQVTLTSDIDGLLMDQNDSLRYQVPSLSVGQHLITLEGVNESGGFTRYNLPLEVVPADIPVAQIQAPIQQQTILSQVPYELTGTAFDFMEGDLCASDSTFWLLGTDTIGFGCNVNFSFSQLGPAQLVFSTSNSLGTQVFDTAQVTILDASAQFQTIDTFPGGNTGFALSCIEVGGCDSTFLISLPGNARVVQGALDISGEYVLLEPEVLSGGTGFGLGGLVSEFTHGTVNNDRGAYFFHRISAALDIDFNDPSGLAPPVNEKEVFKNGEIVTLYTYLFNISDSIEIRWILEYPSHVGFPTRIDTLYELLAVPDGEFIPGIVHFLEGNAGYWNEYDRGEVKVSVATRVFGAGTAFVEEQAISFARDFVHSTSPFDPLDPLAAGHTLSTDIQSTSPNLPINFGIDTVSSTQARIYSNLSLQNVADSIVVYWDWVAPNGSVFSPTPLRVQPPPGQHEWYDWIKAWCYLDVASTSIGSIVGDWEVLVGIEFFYEDDTMSITSIPAVVVDSFTIDGVGNISYPHNPKVRVGPDSIEAWTYSGGIPYHGDRGSFRRSEYLSLCGSCHRHSIADSDPLRH